MSDCNCCCAAYAPPWWVTMGFVPPTNPGGQTHPGVTVPAPPATVTPANPVGTSTQPSQPATGGGTSVGTSVGNAVGGVVGSVVNTLLNPLGALAGLL